MRIYNATNSTINVPIVGTNDRLVIQGKSLSSDVMISKEFIIMLMSAYTSDELGFIISGPFEMTTLSHIPASISYSYQTYEDCLEHFGQGKVKEKVEEQLKKEEEPVAEPKAKTIVDHLLEKEEEKEAVVEEQPVKEEVKEEAPVEEPKPKATPKKTAPKKPTAKK